MKIKKGILLILVMILLTSCVGKNNTQNDADKDNVTWGRGVGDITKEEKCETEVWHWSSEKIKY